MAKQSETNESSLSPKSEEREDSGLQDILAVAAKIKEAPQDELEDASSEREDSGMILFSAGDLGGGDAKPDDDAMFGSFAGGLGSGFGAAVDPISSPDLVPLGGEGSVSETTPPEVRPKPAEEPKRNPLTVLAVVMGLGLVAAGAVYLTSKDDNKAPQGQAQAEMSAKPDGDAAVGKAEPTPDEQASASGGAGAGSAEAVEPEPEPEPVADTEGALLEGQGADGLLAAADTDADDPMAQKQGLLDGGKSPVAKAGKWDQGESNAKPADSQPDTQPEPEPEPVAPEPEPEPEPVKKPASGGSDDEVDCLLNPDLPKCNTGGTSKPKEETILAPKLPEKLDSTALRAGFNTVKSKAKACGSKYGAAAGTKVKVHASIEGASGKVTSVEAQGEHAGTDLGKCVEDAVKGATFEQFKKPSQGVDYSMIM